MTTATEGSPWPLSTIAEHFEVQLGKRFDAAVNRGELKKCMTNRGVRWGRIARDEIFVAPLTVQDITDLRLKAGDVLVCEGGEIGRASVWSEELPECYYANTLHRLRSKTNYDPHLVVALLEYWASSGALWALVGSSTLALLTKENLLRVPLPVPPPAEQRAIANALCDIDDLIASLEHLISKKQAIKQGMMQRIFALPAGPESKADLGSLAMFLSGGTPDRSNAEYWSGTIPWISATTLKDVEVRTSDQFVTEGAVRAGSRIAPLHSTLVLVRGSALHSEIRASLVTARVCFNQDVKALVPLTNVEPKFLTYSIHANASRLLRLVTSAGNTAGVLDTRVLKAFEIWSPDRKTQRRTIDVFDDLTDELGVLSSRLSKARAIKTGMMQQLLTGRTRLPVVAAS